MNPALLDWLVCPRCGSALDLVATVDGVGDHCEEGRLACRGCGGSYPITAGVPRFVEWASVEVGQAQVASSFGYKWRRHAWGHEGATHRFIRGWFLERYGFREEEAIRAALGGCAALLDAGVGSGISAAWYAPLVPGAVIGADISESVDAARERLAGCHNVSLVQADLRALPFRERCFDVILSDGVLHHTPDPPAAFRALVRHLRPGGEIWAYVYRRKGPAREFTDDLVRHAVAHLPADEAWRSLEPITRLGQSLAGLRVTVHVPTAVPILGIPAGPIDLQRLIYWHVLKCFWNDAFTFEENNHITFDWFHPRYAFRYTEEELRGWCAGAGLDIEHWRAEENGYTFRARRPAPAGGHPSW